MARVYIEPLDALGGIKPLHGVNGCSVDHNWSTDLRNWFKNWKIPYVRTHDCPYSAFDTIDLHYIFPSLAADPDDEASYNFTLTDDLLGAIRETGATIYFRLGETIEHQRTMQWGLADRWAPDLLAKVCVNIVRHYNDGWSNGFNWGIRYWEFWNEPDGPKNWSGSESQFFDLYKPVALALKKYNPDLMVGGMGFGWHFSAGDEAKEHRERWRRLISRCVQENVPVDFVSWHKYLDHWSELTEVSFEVRKFLDEVGLSNAESHIGEWSYRTFLRTKERNFSIFAASDLKRYDLCKRIIEIQQSNSAAALVLGALITLQDCPVDMAQYYNASTSTAWGLFDPYGLPNKKGYAFGAFSNFVQEDNCLTRVKAWTEDEEVAVIAAMEKEQASLSIAVALKRECTEVVIELGEGDLPQWTGVMLLILDNNHDWQEVKSFQRKKQSIIIPFNGSGILYLKLTAGSEGISGGAREDVGEKKADNNWYANQ